MTNSRRKNKLADVLASLALGFSLSSLALAEDPTTYSRMGSPLWTLLTERQTEAIPAELLPFYVFTDGESLTVIPRAFTANFNVSEKNPIKIVLPGPETIAESEKYPLLSVSQFIEKNRSFVNKVTSKNPVRTGMLNVYTTDLGTPTTVAHMGGK